MVLLKDWLSPYGAYCVVIHGEAQATTQCPKLLNKQFLSDRKDDSFYLTLRVKQSEIIKSATQIIKSTTQIMYSVTQFIKSVTQI